MQKKLERVVTKYRRIFRSVWTALHPNGWIVLLIAILLVGMMGLITSVYVQGSENRNSAGNDIDPPQIEMPQGLKNEAEKRRTDHSLDELKQHLLQFKASICLLTLGVLVCLAKHKWSRQRPIRITLYIMIVFQFFWFMVFTIQLTMNC